MMGKDIIKNEDDMLQINNLSKSFGDKLAVDKLSLNVSPGEIWAFIGHNGAGKTTTLKAISGIIDFDGEILVNSFNVKTQPFEAKKSLHYIPDNPVLYEHLTGIEQLNFIADVFLLSQAERKSQIEFYAKRLELYEVLSQKISSYSHGMKQKLAILCALIHKPKLLLLDEPFVGLDPKSSHELKLIFNELASSGSAIFYSTHVLEVAEKICSHVAIIKQGKLVCSGTMEEIKGLDSLEKTFLELEDETSD